MFIFIVFVFSVNKNVSWENLENCINCRPYGSNENEVIHCRLIAIKISNLSLFLLLFKCP